MHTYTALYDNRQDAEAAQDRLRSLGVIPAARANISDHQAFQQSEAQGGQGFWGQFASAPPEDDRRLYETSVKQGAYLLTVNVEDGEAREVEQLLENSNAVNIDEREQQYRQTGLLPPAGMSPRDTTMGRTEGFSGSASQTGEQSIPVVAEEIKVGKRQVERGGVRVRSYVVETPVHEQVTLREEHVQVERRPVDQPLRANMGAPAEMMQERTVEMTAVSEEAVVAKEARIVEEVVLRKDASEHVETIDDTVRKTEVEVERLDPTGNAR